MKTLFSESIRKGEHKMIRLIIENSYNSYKDYWAYKEVSKNWESEVEVYHNRDNEPVGAKVIIWYDKGENDKYAEFKIERDEEYGDWFVYDDGMLINDSMDYTDTLEDCIKGCFYYFHTRY